MPRRPLPLAAAVLVALAASASAPGQPPRAAQGDLTVEAAGADGAAVGFPEALVVGNGKEVAATCVPASGSTFPLGATAVTCSAPDGDLGEVTAGFTVTVVDTTAPLVVVTAPAAAEATGPAGARVDYEATATDLVSGTVAAECAPPPGSMLPLGPTTVACRARDAAGNDGAASVTIQVRDTTPPRFSLQPPDLVREANGADGSVVNYALPEAHDAVDGPLPTRCAPAGGRRFGLGTTRVACHAVDGAGNVAETSFAVAVVDTTPPLLRPPPDLVVPAGGLERVPAGHPAVRAFLEGALATDLVTARPQVTTDAPASFPRGATVVTFHAVDEAGNGSTARATVTVSAAPAAPPPAAPADRRPPGEIRRLRVRPGDRRVTITWTLPRDADLRRVLVWRAAVPVASSRPRPPRAIFAGRASRLVDRGLLNGVEYRYIVATQDRAGNVSRGVAFVATAERSPLRAPRDGATIRSRPLLTWAPSPGASYYNVQLYRGGRKVLSAWTTGARLRVPLAWRFAGRAERLRPGRYTWYVWPGRGERRLGRYGPLLGSAEFRWAGPAGGR